jgi:hypothetical protein
MRAADRTYRGTRDGSLLRFEQCLDKCYGREGEKEIKFGMRTINHSHNEVYYISLCTKMD